MAGSFHLVELEKIEAASKGFFRQLAPQLAQSTLSIDGLSEVIWRQVHLVFFDCF